MIMIEHIIGVVMLVVAFKLGTAFGALIVEVLENLE